MTQNNNALLMALLALIAHMTKYAEFAEKNSPTSQIASPEQVDLQMVLVGDLLSALYHPEIIELVTKTYTELSLQAYADSNQPIH